jgi:hypothetical protein
MRYIVGGLMLVGLVLLVILGAADDPYYGDGTSHWDSFSWVVAGMFMGIGH